MPAGRIPPHNLEAEESLLGAMLLSRDAIASAMEICKPEDFYKSSHGHIYQAITSLFSQGEPADWVTVTEELRRRGLLETIGDPSVFVSLQANTPSIGNADYFEVLLPDAAHRYGLEREIEVDAAGLVHAPREPGLGVPIDFALIERKQLATLR